jgi:xanthine/uracil permease
MTGFTEAKLSDNSLWSPSLWLSMISIWAAMAAVVLTGVGLRRTGVLRRTGLVVAIIAGVILLADLALGGAFPPLVVGFFWLAIGIGLVRRPVTATVRPVASTA